jgi:hypothetical protein
VDDPRTELLYSPFHHATVARNTASLWGRRVVEVSLCASVAVARSDLGELFVWGGTSPWWHQVGLRFSLGGTSLGLTCPSSHFFFFCCLVSPLPFAAAARHRWRKSRCTEASSEASPRRGRSCCSKPPRQRPCPTTSRRQSESTRTTPNASSEGGRVRVGITVPKT